MPAKRHRVRPSVSAVRRPDGSVDLEFWSSGLIGPSHVEHFTAAEWAELVKQMAKPKE